MYMLILNFTYPLRCLRVPPVEYHCFRLLRITGTYFILRSTNNPTEFINSLTTSGLPSHRLKLVIIHPSLRKLITKCWLCNSTRWNVRSVKDVKLNALQSRVHIVTNFKPRTELASSDLFLHLKFCLQLHFVLL
jgi:hypothetical protein